MNKIIIAGSVGAGKTTFAKPLSKKLSIPHFELDHLYWLPNWVARPEDERIKIAKEKIAPLSKWITCGNHFYLHEITWDKADTVIWLDYSIWLCLWRALKRALRSMIKREKVVGCNIESLRRFLSRDSILLYIFKNYKRIKRRYTGMINSQEYQHIKLVRLRSPREAKEWLERV